MPNTTYATYEGFSQVTLPLTKMLKKGAKVNMQQGEMVAFNTLKAGTELCPSACDRRS